MAGLFFLRYLVCLSIRPCIFPKASLPRKRVTGQKLGEEEETTAEQYLDPMLLDKCRTLFRGKEIHDPLIERELVKLMQQTCHYCGMPSPSDDVFECSELVCALLPGGMSKTAKQITAMKLTLSERCWIERLVLAAPGILSYRDSDPLQCNAIACELVAVSQAAQQQFNSWRLWLLRKVGFLLEDQEEIDNVYRRYIAYRI